jgi:hypothetical protein
MSTSDVHRSGTASVTSSERSPLWTIGLSALLIALGFARRPSGGASPATSDRRSLGAGRGRSAETPSQIPARGWKDILLRVYHGISKNRILLVAAGVTFYSLLAIFPGIAALISMYGLFAGPSYRSQSSRHDRERRPRWGGRRASRTNDPARLARGDNTRCESYYQPCDFVMDR